MPQIKGRGYSEAAAQEWRQCGLEGVGRPDAAVIGRMERHGVIVKLLLEKSANVDSKTGAVGR